MSGGFRSRTKSAQQGKPGQSQSRQGKPKQRHNTQKRPQAHSRIGDAAREAAFDAVLRVETEDAFGNLVLPQILSQDALLRLADG